eukprot:6365642-Pyramimonas_sp.AAC.1
MRWEVPSQRPRRFVGCARLAGRSAREPARASAAAAMRQPAPSSHRSRCRSGFPNQVANGCLG